MTLKHIESVGTYRRHFEDLQANAPGHTDMVWQRCICFKDEKLSNDSTKWVRGDGSMWVKIRRSIDDARGIVVDTSTQVYLDLLAAGWYSLFTFNGDQFGYPTMKLARMQKRGSTK